MAFKPRTTGPNKGDYYWYSGSPFYPSYGMPNCTTYAWGRFWEILGERPKLCTGNAGTWYSYTQDGYKRGSKPALGAVACWSKPGAAGHVAIVEKINSDGSIVTSESGWQSSTFWWTSTRTPNNYANNAYTFQGFIYNPAVSSSTNSEDNVLAKFLQVARSKIGQDGTWAWQTSGLSRPQPWCAAFVVACAKTVGIAGKVIPVDYGAGSLCRSGVANGWGKFYTGPWHGTNFKPQPGDMIVYRWDSRGTYAGQDKYYSDHIGIVESFDGSVVHTIEGNSGPGGSNEKRKVVTHDYDYTYSCINGYYRPDWEKVGGFVGGLGNGSSGYIGPLYDYENTKQDSIIREIGYLNSSSEPSIKTSDIKLSVVNYTSLFTVMYNAAAPSVLGSSSYVVSSDLDLSNVESVAREIVKFCMTKGLPSSSGVGIVANIYAECSLNISLGPIMDSNGQYSGGMCMWNGANWKAFLEFVGSDWKTNLSGQCEFLFHYIDQNYSWYKSLVKRYYGSNLGLVEYLSQLPNTEAGARQAADVFVRCYERPANMDSQSLKRQGFASDFWKKITPILR